MPGGMRQKRPLHVLEMLLAAGYQPPVYRKIVVLPENQRVAVFNPLRDRPGDFPAKQGEARHVTLLLSHVGDMGGGIGVE